MLSDRTFGLLHQIHEAIQMLKDWNKSILCVDDYYSSPEGMKNLAASCMLIEAIGESVKLIDKMTDGKLLVERRKTNRPQILAHFSKGYKKARLPVQSRMGSR